MAVGALAAPGLEADVRTAGLEIDAVGAGGDLAVGVLGGQPDFQVIGLGGTEAHVARTQGDDAVGQLQLFQQGAGMAHHDLQLVEAVIRMGEAHHLHLGELVQADQAARVLAGGAGLGTEAGRGGTVGAGQVGLVQHLAGVDVGQGHLGGGDEVVVPGGHLEEVFLELGQLAVPYSEGWHIYIDGKEAKTFTSSVAYTGVLIEKGEHTVEMHYISPWIIPGTVLSVAAWIWMALSFAVKKRRISVDKRIK